MKDYHPMVWQYRAAKRLRWWLVLPMRPFTLVAYLMERLYKFLDWYEWKILNRATIWYANRNVPEVWKGSIYYKESNDVSARKTPEGAAQAQTRPASEETK